MPHPPNENGINHDEADTGWMQPNVEDLIVEGQMPEMVVTILIGIDLDTGQRAVNWNVVGGDHGGDYMVALGAVEVVKARLLERMVL